MQFLDAIGLAYFWEKIKNWVNINYLSLTGGTIRGSVSFLNDADGGKSIRIDPSSITNSRYGVNYLFASGKMIPIGEANGIAGLDSNGNVPLAQLGNLDTTVAEVVTALPTTNIKKHIYLIKDASGVTQNQYEEYIYTGDTSATYDASKWEKLGDFRATVDLADYAKKSDTLSNLVWEQRGSDLFLAITMGNGTNISEAMPTASSSTTGAMSNTDKVKLDGIEARANNYFLPLATAAIRGGIKVGYAANGRNYPVQMDGENAYVNIPWTDTNTTYGLATSTKDGLMKASDKAKLDLFDTSKVTSSIGVAKLLTVDYKGIVMKREASSLTVVFNTLDKSSSSLNFTAASPNIAGLMSGADKTKLNGISSGATADSAITTAEIDALFS